MKAPTAIAMTMLLGSGAASAQIEVDWTTIRESPTLSDTAYLAGLDAAGNLIIGGVSESPGDPTQADYLVVKIDPSGEVVWSTPYDGPAARADVPVAMVVAPGGAAYITGLASIANFQASIATVAFTPAGMIDWANLERGDVTVGGNIRGTDIAMAPNGDVVMVGWVFNQATGLDFGAARYAPNGAEVWFRSFGGPGSVIDSAEAVAIDSDGNTVVVGQVSVGGQYDLGVIKYDPAGNVLWSDTRNISDEPVLNFEDNVDSVAIDAAGDIYIGVIARNTGNTFLTAHLVKYESDGTHAWTRANFNGMSFDQIVIGLDGRIIASGLTINGLLTASYEPNGDLVWSSYNEEGALLSDNRREHVAVLSSGDIIVACHDYMGIGPEYDLEIRHFSPDGELLEEKVIDIDVSREFFGAITAGPNNDFYIAGRHEAFAGAARNFMAMRLTVPTGLAADLNGDGIVNSAALGAMLGAWGACPMGGPCPADIDGDGSVGPADLAALLGSWG
ncbi:MAG: hypothetical protein VYC34_01715 [Planctomycetota bacterium]|nr:hypothetical protein [Planctomycetota bacterium]